MDNNFIEVLDKYMELKLLIWEYLIAIESVPMRAIDCDQENVARIEKQLFNIINSDDVF